MRNREWQIGLFGTFDVENYGDLLFPLIAEAELTKRLGAVRLHRFSYNARTPPDWPYTVTSITEFPRMVGDLDGVLIGGGFIIRFDKDVAPSYGPPISGIHHPTGYWLTPAIIALQHGIPLLWNAPGMHRNDLPAWADPLLELAFSLSSYIAVRDEPSKAALMRFAGKSQIAVVPDTAFGISQLLDRKPPPALNRLCEIAGLTGKYIVVQAALGLDFFLNFVRKHAQVLKEYSFLALPIGPVLNDHSAILEACNLPGLVCLPDWPHPLLLAELISRSEAVVGYSYHLAITALASGVPVFTPIDLSVGKYSALRCFETIYHLGKDKEPDLDWFLSRLGKTAPSSMLQTMNKQLAQHWDRISEILAAGPQPTQPAVNQFWQSLPCLLEDAAISYDTTMRSPDVQIAEKQGNIDDLNLRLEQISLTLNARDELIEKIYDSTSWKVTAPMRFAINSLKRLLAHNHEK
jgi:hypothetical protein